MWGSGFDKNKFKLKIIYNNKILHRSIERDYLKINYDVLHLISIFDLQWCRYMAYCGQ